MAADITIGITGGIASGKSTVMAILKKRGIPGISSDELAHAALRRGQPAYQRIKARYGTRILDARGNIDRRRLGEIVFADPRARRWLEKQVHPSVILALKAFRRQHRGTIAMDIPLLFEAGLQKMVDMIVLVEAPRSVQLQRMRARGLSRQAALARLQAQMPISRKRRLADVILKNAESHSSLIRKVHGFLKKALDETTSRGA